jgi:hypothetical protein
MRSDERELALGALEGLHHALNAGDAGGPRPTAYRLGERQPGARAAWRQGCR